MYKTVQDAFLTKDDFEVGVYETNQKEIDKYIEDAQREIAESPEFADVVNEGIKMQKKMLNWHNQQEDLEQELKNDEALSAEYKKRWIEKEKDVANKLGYYESDKRLAKKAETYYFEWLHDCVENSNDPRAKKSKRA